MLETKFRTHTDIHIPNTKFEPTSDYNPATIDFLGIIDSPVLTYMKRRFEDSLVYKTSL
jgi:hypothetical protein